MSMYNPPHPGEFIRETYLVPFDTSARNIADNLGVSPSTFNRIINRQASISPEMAHRLSKVLGRSPESWLNMQVQYDLWHARKNLNLSKLHKIDFSTLSEKRNQQRQTG